MHQTITYLLMRNDPLDEVWRESAMALDFSRTAKFRDVVDLMVSQQRSRSERTRVAKPATEERYQVAKVPQVPRIHGHRS
jgi:hypothetical protein